MNPQYKHILAALDLREEKPVVGEKAVFFARQFSASLTLLHVVEYMPVDLGNELVVPQFHDVEQQLIARAHQQIDGLVHSLGYNPIRGVIECGVTRSVLVDYALEHKVDLIVIGRHGRSGFGKLLGSTADSVVRHAPCDIFVVKV